MLGVACKIVMQFIIGKRERKRKREYSFIFAPDKRDIQKDDMVEYHDTCHEENLFPLISFPLLPIGKEQQKQKRKKEMKNEREIERICRKGLGWSIVRED